MVRPLFGWRLELSRCGVSWNTRGLRGPRVCDILSRISRLLPRRFFALVPIPELGLSEIVTGARPSCDTRPGLRSRPLGRRSGCSSAEPYPPPRPFFSLRPSCPFTPPPAPRDRPTARLSRASRNRRSRFARIRTPRPARSSAGVIEPSAPRTRQSPSTPFRSHLSL